MIKVFIDGGAGTTGLEINNLLNNHPGIEIIKIASEQKKDIIERKRCINESDITILCLPDESAREAICLIENNNVRLIDASSAHRTDPRFVYGMPELSPKHRMDIKNAQLVSNPGCHATGFISLIYPLISSGMLSKNADISAFSLTGYSGGGKRLIEQYEDKNRDDSIYKSVRPYALALAHKHVPEMVMRSTLEKPPNFVPMLGDFYRGMNVCVQMFANQFEKPCDIDKLLEIYTNHYKNEQFIKINDHNRNGVLYCASQNNTNNLEIFVYGNKRELVLSATFDNLGKGAGGACIQNLNIMTGMKEDTGLC